MTKEELEKEYKHYSNNTELQTAYEWGYKDGAEPREKRITDLEQAKNIITLCRDTLKENGYDFTRAYKQAEQFIKEIEK